ncbi:MAG: hypothetical protein HGA66_10735 [Holophaga sp.]|nr:hypothetical protein [Holophaga sp.]
MLLQPPPPPAEVLQVRPEWPVFAGSDPLLLGVLGWTLDHSPTLARVFDRLLKAEPKARYRLTQGFDKNYGRLVVRSDDEFIHVEIQVPMLAWKRCGDAVEPWLATAIFLAATTAERGDLRGTPNPDHFKFLSVTRNAAFALQKEVRKELEAADPVRFKDMPYGWTLYVNGFRAEPGRTRPSQQRPLPPGLN